MPTGRRSARLCLGATKANVKEGEFAGVELTFMGLNNQNLHNVLFRGFLKPWEAYTGAKINWIDLAQADYNARLQQSIATGTVDFDILEMGAPFEGDVCGKGLASEMPDWVKKQIDMDDYRRLPEAAGRHLGRQDLPHLRSTATATTSTTAPTSSPTPASPKPGRPSGGAGRMGRAEDLAAGAGGHQVPEGQAGQRPGRLRLSRRAEGLGRLRLLLPRQPRQRLCQASGRQGLAVRSGHHEAARQQPGLGAGDPGRHRRAAVRAAGPDQRRSEPDRVLAVPRRHRLDAGLVGRRRLQRQDQRRLGGRRRHRLLDPARLRRRLQLQDRRMGQARQRPELCAEHAPISAGASMSWPASTATRRRRRRRGRLRPISAARTCRCGCAAYPSGFQPYRNCHFNIPEWVAAGYDEAFITSYLELEGATATTIRTPRSSRASPASSSTIRSPRTNWRRSSPASATAQEGADAIAAAWEKITDQIGRDNQIKLYKASLGM